MVNKRFKNKYLSYLKSIVCDDRHPSEGYSRLFETLFDTTFYAVLEMDENRMADAIELRVNYERNNGYSAPMMTGPPSVLEVMVALADRCEQNIMGNFDYGDRTPVWFWYMVESMGLNRHTDDYYDEFFVRGILESMMNRAYSKDGYGSLFYIPTCNIDLTNVEIWYQMNFWLDTIGD